MKEIYEHYSFNLNAELKDENKYIYMDGGEMDSKD